MRRRSGRAASSTASLALEIVRVTEATAIAAARLRGRGDEAAADEAAVDAMYRELARLPIQGVVVVGEGEENESAAALYRRDGRRRRRARARGRYRRRSDGGLDALPPRRCPTRSP